ncbi:MULTISPECIES: hypothetical protein [unclassified Pseudomonas]|jgi:hypothetical protein|uniref:hypothetical protein n=1 Tax=unclassified Pseudomonas TaxID=196821 RepID=UPI00072FD056|nr:MULTISPECIES: hypothetical protein [unclassified Pseudomonas]KSW23060.1 hypothetical protein AOX63_06565 [Pseudomonas sp. ADP]OBP08772.1 hypothetical protein BAE52_22240 [Pseudomonas sp. EGD-AKN5]QOF86003.1 hypothetical protein IG194_04715 [Pseudomonas sp. ADPe]
MTLPPAGSQKKGLFSREDYLAPPAIPTGQPPRDVLNTIWRKNEVFLDIGQYSIGSFVMMAWPMFLLFLWGALAFRETLPAFSLGMTIGGLIIVGVPSSFVLYSLTQPVPPPTRFNRQRREVCVPQKDGSYWIVPWETVVAQAIAMDSVGRHGKTTQGMLVVGFKNPDPNAKEGERDCSMGFSCGGGTTAMRLWECMRSYMEVGPEAVPDNLWRLNRKKGILASYIDDVIEAGKTKGWLRALLWEGFCGLIVFNTLLIDLIERKKLSPPPDLTDPNIVEWSKPLPPEQWAKRSPEWDEAIRQREAELAREAAT